ncbi:hypothetical protein [Niallia circulans]|nr:hypothetical protein [Niallia circulans]
MRDNKFIIEHMDNNPHNCSIENLAFAHEDLNKTKAFSLDKDRPAILDKVAMNIYKNFDNQDFEITLGFNDFYFLRYEENSELKYKPLTALYLRYKDDFRTMLMEANSLVNKIMNNSTIGLAYLDCYEYTYDTANFISPPEGMEVKDLPPIVFQNNTAYMVLTDKNRLFSVGPSWRERHFKLNEFKK